MHQHPTGRDLTRQALLLEEQGIGAPHQALWPLGSALGEPSPQNVWAGNPKEQISRCPKVLLETEIPLLESSGVVLLAPRPSEKTAD